MKKLLVAFLFLSSCASTKMPIVERSINKKYSAKERIKDFDSGIIYLSRVFKNPDKVIKYKNKDKGLVIISGNIKCNKLRQLGDFNNYILKYNLDIKYLKNYTELNFSNLYIAHKTGKEVSWGNNQISSKEKLKSASTCLNGLINGLK